MKFPDGAGNGASDQSQTDETNILKIHLKTPLKLSFTKSGIGAELLCQCIKLIKGQ